MKKLVCHCGAIEAEINLDGDLAKVIKCNCSICKRKGAIMSMVKNEDFKIVKGEDKLKLYQFHSKVAKHYFCSIALLNLGTVKFLKLFDLTFLKNFNIKSTS